MRILRILACVSFATICAIGPLPAQAGKPPGGGTGTPSYLGVNLGTLPGDSQSDAWGVNARGHVVGRSLNNSRLAPTLVKAFYRDSTMHQLSPATEAPAGEQAWDSEAWAISNEATETVVGMESRELCYPDPKDTTQTICDHEQYPLVWQDPGTSPAADRLDQAEGQAVGINDSGDLAVGTCGGGLGAIWSRSNGNWSRTNIQSGAFPAEDLFPAFPDGHDLTDHQVVVRGSVRDVNDEGIVVGSLTWIDQTAAAACRLANVQPCTQDTTYSQAYVYFARDAYGFSAGTGRVLAAPSGQGDNDALAVSNVGAGGTVFYVAGVTRVTPDDAWGKGIRWTVSLDGQGGQTVQSDILAQQVWSQGVNEAGHVAGTSNSKVDRRGNIIQSATLFKQSVGYITLKPPSGGSDGTSRSMAGVGPIYVVGEANVKGAWRAAMWTIP